MVERPMYKIIADRLRSKIEAGELKGGQQLPTELELREENGNASRNTVRDAVRSLINQGLVESFPGRGTFVKNRGAPFVITFTEDPETGFGGGEGEAFEREVRTRQRQPSTTSPKVEIQLARPEISSALALGPGAAVISRHQRLHIDGQPWSLQTSFYSLELVGRGAQRLAEPSDIEQGTVRYLEEELGIAQVGYRDKLRVRPARQDEETFFELRAGQKSVLENSRVAYELDGTPIRLTLSVFHPERTEIALYNGTVPPESLPEE